MVSSHALEETTLLHVSRPAVLDELERSPLFARKMLAGLSRRLHGLISDVEAYSLDSGTQRVIGYLLREDPAGGDDVQLHVSKVVLASRLNLSPEHFSRILHDLIRQHLIQVHGRTITILDVEGLRRYDK
jgi:CRP-like cAMP-binding protein